MSAEWLLLLVPVAAALFFACGYCVRYCTERIQEIERVRDKEKEKEEKANEHG